MFFEREEPTEAPLARDEYGVTPLYVFVSDGTELIAQCLLIYKDRIVVEDAVVYNFARYGIVGVVLEDYQPAAGP